MYRPQTLTESPENLSSVDENHLKVYVSSLVYDDFIKRIEKAEKFASDHKLGIWKNN